MEEGNETGRRGLRHRRAVALKTKRKTVGGAGAYSIRHIKSTDRIDARNDVNETTSITNSN